MSYLHIDTTHAHVYALQMLGRAFVKIGCTRNLVPLRLRRAQYSCPVPLFLLGEVEVFTGAFRVEKELKKMLAPCPHYGEWFAVSMNKETFYALVHGVQHYLAGLTDDQRPSTRRRPVPAGEE